MLGMLETLSNVPNVPWHFADVVGRAQDLVMPLESSVKSQVEDDLKLGVKGILMRRRAFGSRKKTKPRLQMDDIMDSSYIDG